MPRLNPSHVAIAGLAIWLMLRVVDLPGVDGTALQPLVLGTGLQAHVGELALGGLVLLRIVRVALQGHETRGWATWLLLPLWLGLCAWAGASLATALVELQASARVPLVMIDPGWLRPALSVTLAVAGAVAWWVADRLDAIGLDGAFVLLLPELAVYVADWHIDTINHVLVGLVSPWRVLDSPLLPLSAAALLLVARQPAPDSRVLGAWGPRTALPVMMLPFVVHQLASALGSPPAWVQTLAPWLGVLLSAAVLLRCRPARRKPWWPLLTALMLPVALLTAVGTVWASGVFSSRIPGESTLVADVVYERPVGEGDLQRIRDRLAAARLAATVQPDGATVRITLRKTSPQRALRWLERSAAAQGQAGLHRVAAVPKEQIEALTQGSTDPRTWAQPPDGLELAQWRCPRWCRPTLVHPSVLPDHPVLDAEATFDPDRMSADVIVRLTPEALQATDALVRDHLGEQAAVIVDGRIYSQGPLSDTDGDGDLRLRVGNPWRARWLAERLAGGTLDVGAPVRVDLVRVE